jgi:hypothetical protein
VAKLYDAYAEAWADQPLQPSLHEETSAEADRFLAWTQMDRYVELAVLASTQQLKAGAKPGQYVVPSGTSQPPAPAAEAPPAEAAPEPAGEKPPDKPEGT